MNGACRAFSRRWRAWSAGKVAKKSCQSCIIVPSLPAAAFKDEWGVPRIQQALAGDLTAVVLADVCTSVNEAYEPEQPLGRRLHM